MLEDDTIENETGSSGTTKVLQEGTPDLESKGE